MIEDGEWLAVQGRSGHGKSTLLNLPGGPDRPAEGTVELDGTGLGALRDTQEGSTAARSPSCCFCGPWKLSEVTDRYL